MRYLQTIATPFYHTTDNLLLKKDLFISEMKFNNDELFQLQKFSSIFIEFGLWHISYKRKVKNVFPLDYASL